MKNAKKLAKDTGALAILLQHYCDSYCMECPIERIGCRDANLNDYDDTVRWLESEAEEDAEIH